MDAQNTTFNDLAAKIGIVWQGKKFIAKTVSISTILITIIVFLLPQYFRSTVVLIPQIESPNALGSISSLASLAGVNLGGNDDEKVFPVMLKSESLLKTILYKKYNFDSAQNPQNLIEYWEITGDSDNEIFEKAYIKMTKELEIETDNETGALTVSILTTDPNLSALVVNEIVLQLDVFVREKKKSYASEQRQWIEARLTQVQYELTQSEDSLKKFREKNRVIINSPELLLKQGRLERAVEMNTIIFSELKKQLELVKIEEIKNIPVINVIDWGRPAAKKEKPKRVLIIIFGILLSLITSIFYVLYRENGKKKVVAFIEQTKLKR